MFRSTLVLEHVCLFVLFVYVMHIISACEQCCFRVHLVTVCLYFRTPVCYQITFLTRCFLDQLPSGPVINELLQFLLCFCTFMNYTRLFMSNRLKTISQDYTMFKCSLSSINLLIHANYKTKGRPKCNILSDLMFNVYFSGSSYIGFIQLYFTYYLFMYSNSTSLSLPCLHVCLPFTQAHFSCVHTVYIYNQ